jgi:DNA-binding transcriptional MerR regulator
MDQDARLYSLADLADRADVTPRTIRYYIAQGLLPPPIGAGPTTRYSPGHLGRLRLVRELQRQHLPLAEIRARLERLSDDEVAELTVAFERRPASPAPAESAIEYIRTLLATSSATVVARPPQPRMAPPPAMAQPPAMAPAPPRPLADAASVAPPASSPDGATTESSPAQPGRSQWDRISLAPDIELHVRRPLSRIQNRAVDRLVVFARKLLEEDPS